MRHFAFALCLSAAVLIPPSSALGQDRSPRFGAGTHLMLSTIDGLGLGLTGRVSIPVNGDVSLAIGSGITSFLFGGTEDAEWLLTPQVSVIVTLPGVIKAPYFTFGGGGYLPIGNPGSDRSGPAIHFGAGWVRPLSQSTLFYEIDPMLVLQASRIDLALPVRIGVIF